MFHSSGYAFVYRQNGDYCNVFEYVLDLSVSI